MIDASLDIPRRLNDPPRMFWWDIDVALLVLGAALAGMVAGFRSLEQSGGRVRRVLGVDASAKPVETHEQVTRIAAGTAAAASFLFAVSRLR